MSQDRIVLREKGREYTVTGKQVGRALTYFTFLSAFRTTLTFIAYLVGSVGGVGVVAKVVGLL